MLKMSMKETLLREKKGVEVHRQRLLPTLHPHASQDGMSCHSGEMRLRIRSV